MYKILIVEDDVALRGELQVLLERSGYEAMIQETFDDLEKKMEISGADLILLDINLPGVDGESVLRQFRKNNTTPVIMVTSRNTEMDELLCMSYGADDFITKPYHPSILLLHIEAVLKRLGQVVTADLTYKNMKVDVQRGMISKDGCEVELTKNEMKILNYLLNNRGQIVSRDGLMDYLWDTDSFIDDNTLTVNITRVRRKLEELGLEDVIITRRGQGYMIR